MTTCKHCPIVVRMATDFTHYRVTYTDGTSDVFKALDFDELVDIAGRESEWVSAVEISADEYRQPCKPTPPMSREDWARQTRSPGRIIPKPWERS